MESGERAEVDPRLPFILSRRPVVSRHAWHMPSTPMASPLSECRRALFDPMRSSACEVYFSTFPGSPGFDHLLLMGPVGVGVHTAPWKHGAVFGGVECPAWHTLF